MNLKPIPRSLEKIKGASVWLALFFLLSTFSSLFGVISIQQYTFPNQEIVGGVGIISIALLVYLLRVIVGLNSEELAFKIWLSSAFYVGVTFFYSISLLFGVGFVSGFILQVFLVLSMFWLTLSLLLMYNATLDVFACAAGTLFPIVLLAVLGYVYMKIPGMLLFSSVTIGVSYAVFSIYTLLKKDILQKKDDRFLAMNSFLFPLK